MIVWRAHSSNEEMEKSLIKLDVVEESESRLLCDEIVLHDPMKKW